MGLVWCNDLVQAKGLTLLSTASLKLVLCNTGGTACVTKALAESTAYCCGISTHVNSNAIEAFGGTPPGRMVFFQKTTDIAGRKCSTKWITNVGLTNASTLIFFTKCSTRNYSTAGPDKINASSFAVIFYDPSTAT